MDSLKISTGFPESFNAQIENITGKTLNGSGNEWLMDIIQAAPSIQNQIPLLMLAVQAKEDFYKNAEKLRQDVETALMKKFNIPLKVKLFGSVATHTALKDSDVDLYMDLRNYSITEKALTEFFVTQKNEYKIFQKIELISAEVPIFKGISVNKLQCDVSYTSPFAVYSSDLIDYFVTADDRIRQLIILLKFWLKKQGLYGGGDTDKFKSHALVLLVIFCLQQSQQLPSIYSLQKQCAPQEIVEKWIVSFNKNRSQISIRSSLIDMLKNFFAYYAEFDFKDKVISPFIGKVLSKDNFGSVHSIPLEFERLRKNLAEDPKFLNDFDNVIIVQDFIVHNGNVAKNISFKRLNKFKHACAEAYKGLKTGYDNGKIQLFPELFKPLKFVAIVENSESGGVEKTLKIIKISVVGRDTDLNQDEIKEFHTFLYNLLTRVMNCGVSVQDTNVGKTYKCVTNNQIVLNEDNRRIIWEAYHFRNKETIIEMAEKRKTSFRLNQISGNNSTFDIVCEVKNNPSRIECHLICNDNEKRELVRENMDGLAPILRKWAMFEL